METFKNIEQHLKGIPLGRPFVSAEVARFGNRAATDQVLSRMARSGQLLRVARGIYVKPKLNPLVGVVRPGAYEVALAVCQAAGARIALPGAAWAYNLGLTTQMMANPLYLTDGTTRHIRLGKANLILLHASPRAMRLANSPAGGAILALEWLMEPDDRSKAIAKIRAEIGLEAFPLFLAEAEATGGWIAAAARSFGRTRRNA